MPRTINPLLFTVLFSGGINYLFREEFNDADPAPLTSPYNELTVVENDGSFAASGGRLEYTAQTTPSVNDLRVYTTDTLNRDGIALCFAYIDITSDFAVGGETIALSNDTIFLSNDFAFTIGIDTAYPLSVDVGNAVISDNDSLMLCAVGNDGYFYRVRDSVAKLLFVVDISTINSDVYAIFENRNSTGSIDALRVAGLNQSLFSPTIDIASPVTGDGSVSGGDPALPDADFFAQVDAPTSGAFEMRFRVQDDDNYWLWDIDTTNNQHRIIEVVATVQAVRLNPPVTVNASDLMTLIADGSDITIYRNNNNDGTYSSATNFQTETGWDVDSGGTGTANLRIWSRNAQGSLESNLLQVVS